MNDKKMRFSQSLQFFERELQQGEKSQNTILSYKRDLCQSIFLINNVRNILTVPNKANNRNNKITGKQGFNGKN